MKFRSKALDRLLPAALLAALAFQTGSFIVAHSNTVDEMAYIGSGAAYVRTGRLDIDILEHPPLMKYIIGLALLPVSAAYPSFSEASRLGSYVFGHGFLYHNPAASPETILALARLPSLLLSLVLGAFVFGWARRWHGPWGGIFALAAYCFEPNILTHSALAAFDLGLTCFLFLAACFLIRWMETRRSRDLLGAGLLAGCAIATKIPGLIFLVWAPFLLALGTRRKRDGAKAFGILLAASAAVVLLAYQFRFMPDFAELFRYRLEQTFFPAPSQADPVFLHGAIRLGGWRSYFAAALLLKTTIPFLLLCGWAVAAGRDRRRLLLLGFPVLSYLLFASFASKQGGLRYALPVLPFLCVLVGGLADAARGRAGRAAAALLLAWCALECAGVYPRYLPYFNELAGGPKGGNEWFWDSNVDWGQDFPAIGEYVRRQGRAEIVFASPFNADRDHFLGERQDLLGDPNFEPLHYRHVNSEEPARELLLVSAVMLRGCTLNDPGTFSWLLAKEPVDRIAYNTFVYDVTRDAPSHYYMGLIYRNNRRFALAAREFRRAAKLAPRNPLPREALRVTSALMKHDAR